MKVLLLIASLCFSNLVLAEQECKVSMMGRVCYENGEHSEVVASHMKTESAKTKQDKEEPKKEINVSSSK